MAKAKESETEEKATPAKKGSKKAKVVSPRTAAKKKAATRRAATKTAKAKEETAAREKAEAEAKKPTPKKTPAKKAAKKTPAKKAAPKRAAAPKKAKAEPEAPPKAEVAAKVAPEEAKARKPPKARPEPIPPELLLFGRWDLSEVEVGDPGLRRHINLTPTFLPHTGGRWANRPYTKSRVNLVERLVNHMMRTEKYTGKKSKTIQVVERAFEAVERKAKRHPVQVLVDGLQNAAPREETTRLRFGGISVPRAVDIAPARRLDLALRHLSVGAVQASYKNRKPIWQCLADEMLLAANGDMNSYAVGKKEEMERIAASAR